MALINNRVGCVEAPNNSGIVNNITINKHYHFSESSKIPDSSNVVSTRSDYGYLQLATHVGNRVTSDVTTGFSLAEACFTKVLLEFGKMDKKEASEQNKKLLLELIYELEQEVTNAFDSVIRLRFGKNLRELSVKSRLDNDQKLQEVVGFFERNLGRISSNLLGLKIVLSKTQKIWDESFFSDCKSIVSSTEESYQSLIKDSLKFF